MGPLRGLLLLPLLQLGLTIAFLLFQVPAAFGQGYGVTFERAFEVSDIVCIADDIEDIPAATPTPESPVTAVLSRLIVRHMWKGAGDSRAAELHRVIAN